MKNDDFKLEQEIVAAAKDVFSTMVMMELEDERAVIGQSCEISSNISSMLGLGGGYPGSLGDTLPCRCSQGDHLGFSWNGC